MFAIGACSADNEYTVRAYSFGTCKYAAPSHTKSADKLALHAVTDTCPDCALESSYLPTMLSFIGVR